MLSRLVAPSTTGYVKVSHKHLFLFHLLFYHCCSSSVSFLSALLSWFCHIFMLGTCRHVTALSLYDYYFHYLTRPPRIIDHCLMCIDSFCLYGAVLWFSEDTPICEYPRRTLRNEGYMHPFHPLQGLGLCCVTVMWWLGASSAVQCSMKLITNPLKPVDVGLLYCWGS